MKSYEIHLGDWERILTGGVSAGFYFELAFRAAYLFILILICMRALGKRMAAQLSRNDMAALVTLAAAIGVPMIGFDRGLLPSTIIALVMLGLSRLFALQNAKHHSAQRLVTGKTSSLVNDGIIDAREMRRCRMSRERLFAQLRSQHIVQLGQVKRAYLETTGSFSVIPEKRPKAGLLVLPSADDAFVIQQVGYTDKTICLECGTIAPLSVGTGNDACPNCGQREYTQAVANKKD
jgi:uncharacterized membrane protein YcaP (DUF421 family)